MDGTSLCSKSYLWACGGGGNQSLGIMILYSMQGVFKVIREGEIAKDIILLCSLALFCFVLFLFYFCCCCWCRLTVFPLSALMIKIKVRYYYSNCMFKGCYLSYNLNSRNILWQASVKYCNEIWKSLDWIGKNKESLKETNQCKGKGYGRIESPSFLLKPSSNIFKKSSLSSVIKIEYSGFNWNI